jgi:putative endonuclease
MQCLLLWRTYRALHSPGMQHSVYVLTNRRNTILYVGVTGNLARRIAEHQYHAPHGECKRYLGKLVFVEVLPDRKAAMMRYLELKRMSRLQREILIAGNNPDWLEMLV